VKLSSAREERSEQLRRDRAAARALRAVFPGVQQLRLDMQFEGTTANIPAAQSHVLYPPAPAFFAFPCPYADCDGRFDLTAAVNTALAAPSHQAGGVMVCQGGRAHNRAAGQPCRLNLKYKIAASYQQDS
jgi:hypothetical protein